MDLQNFVKIPAPLQIALDDTGWFCPTDDRADWGPSRSGMPRRHTAADYEAIERLGKALDMRINCGFVIGEWDMTNELKRLPNFSKYGDNWDNASHRDPAELERCVDIINRSPHIDFAIHGLLHGYYRKGTDNHDSSDYYYAIRKGLYLVPPQEIRDRLEAFLDLAHKSGIRKTINTMIPPSFVYRKNDLSKILAEFGIEVVSTIFASMYPEAPNGTEKTPCDDRYAFAENGIVVTDRLHNPLPWDQCESVFKEPEIPDGIIGIHWPNILHRDPERSGEVVDAAAEYFRSRGQIFGVVLSPDMHFSAVQSLFRRYSSMKIENGCAVYDWSAIPTVPATRDPRFAISSALPLEAAFGAVIEKTDRKDGFANYLVRPTEKVFGLRPAAAE